MGGERNKDLHPNLVFNKVVAVIWIARRVQLILSYNGDSTDPILCQRTAFKCNRKTGFGSQGTIGKNDGNTNLLRSVHMQRPKQRHWQDEEHEIDKNVAETKHDFHLDGRDRTHSGGLLAHAINESTSYWPAGENDQENTDRGPQGHDDADCPSGVAEFWDDFKDPIHEYEDGEFGKGD